MPKTKWVPLAQWSGFAGREPGERFDPEFKEWFLDIWYRESRETFDQALKICHEIGDDMLVWLHENHPELQQKIWEITDKESLLPAPKKEETK